MVTVPRSLSARRAWIEILIILYAFTGVLVALRKESVDRNIHAQNLCICIIQSLSARRAWIEIVSGGALLSCFGVALRKESVDRNIT